MEEQGGIHLYAAMRNDPISLIDTFGLLTPRELFFIWDIEKRTKWMHDFRDAFDEAISKAAKDHCVPKRLIAAIMANEQADWQWPDGTVFDGFTGGGIGPAQIALTTAINEGVTGFEGLPFINEEMLMDLTAAKLDTAKGAADIAGRLLRKYLAELCEHGKKGDFGPGLLKSYVYGDCNLDKLCCSGLMNECDKLIDYKPSKCLLRMMAAFWNSNREVLRANDLVTDVDGMANFTNAYRNARWAQRFHVYLDDLVK